MSQTHVPQTSGVADFAETAINVKLWRDDYASTVEQLVPGVRAIGEPVGTMEGSGCAMLNVMAQLRADMSVRSPSLGLLAAGEGSRLWGVSAAAGFVKGLVNVFGRSLAEQSVVQARELLSQAPDGGRDFVLMSGTDNVFVAQHALTLYDTGLPFAQCQSRGLFTFSVPIRVTDEHTGQPLPGVLERLSQLGIMLSDGKGNAAMFREKPTDAQTLADLKHFNAHSCLANAFVFALGKDAARFMCELYSRPLPSTLASGATATPLFATKDFDWSGHVLTPLALVHAGQRMQHDTSVFPDVADWQLVLDCAQQFYSRFGPIQILNAGPEALWYDAGLAADLVSLCRLALVRDRSGEQLRSTFALAPLPRDGPVPSLLVRCTVHDGATVTLGRNCIVSNCVFLPGARVSVPDDCVLISCRFGAGDWPAQGSVGGALCYGLQPQCVPRAQTLARGSAYFAYADEHSVWHQGVFPIEANPKYGNLLNQPIEGIGKSFRELQRERAVSLRHTLIATEMKE